MAFAKRSGDNTFMGSNPIPSATLADLSAAVGTNLPVASP